ncbi:carbon monoxide dehydrogenase subunit G [Nonomuraea sp. PA05]|uniref:SRPBCC family protein n=1 Tax=Nonomuraea sp. PA05 TaxID=2604466 RepID=UPI0011DA9CAE|nr:carbon monoxide dehydrogenase subunit G [Nonomuraea sp. PA05]TYB68603.1 carbon monoxide dehydrogenase subunit G [Nonomuraea sp. PA05]
MKLAGSAEIGVDRQRVWAALRDPEVLVRTLPGCERLEETGPDAYRMTINAGVGSIKGVYQGEVALSDPLEPESFTLKARGQGAPGTVDATVLVRLSEHDGGTRVDYEAEAVVGGMIGGVGQRMLGSVAKRTAGEFFSAVEQHLTAPAAPDFATELATAPAEVPTEVPTEVPAARGGVYERPPKQHTETRPWVMLASFGMGAGVALAGATLGWLLGRGSRRRGA